MSEIFNNAITSIVLGVEDFETGTDARMLSAARNYYAGLLLLAKECLVRAAPNADAMAIIGAKFKPVPNGNGGVEHEVEGYATIDLYQLQQRFKDFGLKWPNANIKKLQKFRNDLEHYHLKEPASALSEAIASSFPMVVDFFEILMEDPQSMLADVWDTILAERAAFQKIQEKCVGSLEIVDWPAEVYHLDQLACPGCGSSLVGQVDAENSDHDCVEGKCYQCGQLFSFENTMEIVVEASYGVNAYELAKNGEQPPIVDCPECGATTYVETGGVSVCFNCKESVAGECARCSNDISAHDFDPDHPALCSYCGYMLDKVMRE